MLDLLPEIVPNVMFIRSFWMGSDVTNFQFLVKFRAMKYFELHLGTLTLDELEAIVGNRENSNIGWRKTKKDGFSFYTGNKSIQILEKKETIFSKY